MMMLALLPLLLGAPAGQAAATDRRCGADPDQHVRHCLNETHTALRGCSSGELRAGSARRCDAGFACSASTGACEADDIGTHLLRSVDYQIVETVIASEAQTCSEQDPLADAIAGKMLVRPLTLSPEPIAQASQGLPRRACWGGAQQYMYSLLLTARAPHLLISAGLMEFLAASARCCMRRRSCSRRSATPWGTPGRRRRPRRRAPSTAAASQQRPAGARASAATSAGRRPS